MAEDSGGDRTEKATGKRREQARNKGQVAKSQEVTGAVLLIAGISVLLASSGHFARVLGGNAAYLFSQAHVLGDANLYSLQALMAGNLRVMATALAPILLAVMLAAVGANLAQIGFHASAEALQFRLDKLNPLAGMKRFFRKNALFELVKNSVKVVLIGLLAWGTVKGLFASLAASSLLPLPFLVSVGKANFTLLMAKLLAFALLVALLDWFWQKREYENSLKMSKYEVRQEHKDIEGDPQIKARVRGLQFEMARKRMLAAVPQADVVVTNPTHFAVALKYEKGQPAPVVVAKGQDHLAEVIKKIARKSRVPVIENKPLARALYRQVEIGRAIPDGLFQAVAEVLAYVYRLKKA